MEEEAPLLQLESSYIYVSKIIEGRIQEETQPRHFALCRPSINRMSSNCVSEKHHN